MLCWRRFCCLKSLGNAGNMKTCSLAVLNDVLQNLGRLRSYKLRVGQTSLWYVQHSTLRMVQEILTPWMLRWSTMTLSIKCHCSDLGCIQVVLYLSASLNKVFVMHRLCSAHFTREACHCYWICPSHDFPKQHSSCQCLFSSGHESRPEWWAYYLAVLI